MDSIEDFVMQGHLMDISDLYRKYEALLSFQHSLCKRVDKLENELHCERAQKLCLSSELGSTSRRDLGPLPCPQNSELTAEIDAGELVAQLQTDKVTLPPTPDTPASTTLLPVQQQRQSPAVASFESAAGRSQLQTTEPSAECLPPLVTGNEENALDIDMRAAVSPPESTPAGKSTETAIDCLEEQHLDLKIIAGCSPDVFAMIKGRKPTNYEQAYCISEVSANLRKTIHNKGYTAEGATENIQLNQQFVRLLLIKDGNQATSSEQQAAVKQITSPDTPPNIYHDALRKVQSNVSYTDILQEDTQLILLYDTAGLGKTTLSEWLALKWAENQWANEFSCVFMLDLRFFMNTKRTMTMRAFLLWSTLGSVQGSCPEFDLWLSHWAENIILFIDGVDELPDLTHLMKTSKKILTLDDKATPLELCVGILRRDVLSDSVKIVASRPFVGLSEALQPDSTIQLLGFTQEMVLKYIEEHVSQEKVDHVKHVFQENPFVKSVSSIPFYTTSLCIGLQQDNAEDVLGISTHTQLTAFLILTLGTQNMPSHPGAMGMAQGLMEILSPFVELALWGLDAGPDMRPIFYFELNDIIDHGISKSMLQAMESTGLFHTKRSPDGKIFGEFVHQSTQEFLAMLGLLLKSSKEGKQVLTKMAGTFFNTSRPFLYGLAFDLDKWIKALRVAVGGRKVAKEVVEEDLVQRIQKTAGMDGSQKLHLITVAFEAQSEEIAKRVANKLVSQETLTLNGAIITAIDVKAIMFVSEYTTVTRLNLDSNQIGDPGARALAEGLRHNNTLIRLHLHSNQIGDPGARALAEGLRHNNTLTELYLSGNGIGAEGARHLKQAQRRNTSVYF